MYGDSGDVVRVQGAPDRDSGGTRVVVRPGGGTTFDGDRLRVGLVVEFVEDGTRRRSTAGLDRGLNRAARLIRNRGPPVVWLADSDQLARTLPAVTVTRLRTDLAAAAGAVGAPLVIWTGSDGPDGSDRPDRWDRSYGSDRSAAPGERPDVGG